MPTNEIITETIAKLTKRIEELKTQISQLDTKCNTTYATSISLADAIVSWDAVENATSYDVLADGESIGEVSE